MHYVKVEKGIIVDGPRELSQSESDSPNVHWGPDQLRANSWFEVDLTHDPLTERIDYANPNINGDYVSYPRLPLTESESKSLFNKAAIISRIKGYRDGGCSIEELTVALWELVVEDRHESAEAIQKIRELIKAKNYKK